jgi:flagellin
MINSVNGINSYNKFSVSNNNENEKLASGKKINSAKDDAAGLAIINRLTSEINASSKYVSNSLDAVNYISTSDSALNSINTDTSRIRELTLQSGSGLNKQADIDAIQNEINGLQENISSTIQNSNFGGQPLFNNSTQFGINNKSNMAIETNIVDNLNIDLTNPQQSLKDLDAFVENVNSQRGKLGAQANALESNVSSLLTNNENQSASRSRIQDTDYAKSSSNKSINDALNNINILIQKQENQNKGNLVNLIA